MRLGQARSPKGLRPQPALRFVRVVFRFDFSPVSIRRAPLLLLRLSQLLLARELLRRLMSTWRAA